MHFGRREELFLSVCKLRLQTISTLLPLPFAVAARSKARTVFARSNTEIVVSNPSEGMGVCACSVRVYSVWRRIRILPP
jgi:hypothetical protein